MQQQSNRSCVVEFIHSGWRGALALTALLIIPATSRAQDRDVTRRAGERPPDATALCGDGSYSFSTRPDIACLGHLSIRKWFGSRPIAPVMTRAQPVLAKVDTVHVLRVDTVRIRGSTDTVMSTTGSRWFLRKVFFATDRAKDGPWTSGVADEEDGFFDGKRASNSVMSFGSVDVSIPKTHKAGEIEHPALYAVWSRPDASRFMQIVNVTVGDEASLLNQIREDVQSAITNDVLVFVHGYNVGFRDALLRTAQLAWDLKFDGPAIAFSWPSRGDLGSYVIDRNEAERSASNLRHFLDSVTAATGADRVHVIAHSVGALVLGRALALAGAPTTRLRQVVLAAPDIDADVFTQQIMPAFRAQASSTTLYASSHDRALAAARYVVGGAQRAGEIRPAPVLAPGLDTIDASSAETDMLGHSVVFQNRVLIDDLFNLVTENKSAANRRLRLEQSGARQWWVVP